MSKNSRKAVKKAPVIIKEDKDCQTEELLGFLADISIADSNLPTTSTTCAQDLTKEQLITRLSLSQSLCKRLKALLIKERQLRKDEQQKFVTFFHEIKVLLHDSRHSYNIVKQELSDSTILFVNGRETLRQKMEAYQQKCQSDFRAMRDSIARNDVVIEKANLTIMSTKQEVEKTLKISDETRKKIQKATTDKGFIETQYKALVKKQNEKYIAAGEYCPKCSATKIVLKEFGDDVKKLKSDVSRLEKECQAISSQKSAIENDFMNLQKEHNKVVYERDIYKKDDKILRDQLAKAKKALSETTNSPNRNLKLLEALNSPARLENSPILTKETPPPPIKAEKSPTPPDKTPIEKSAEPPPKKRTNGTSLSREEGEVTPEDETTKSPSIIKHESPPLKPNESRKRPLPPKPSKAEKPKQMDYVYVINDRQKPPDKMPKQEAKSLLKQDIRPPPGFLESRPRPRHQSPPYMFDSQPHPSQQQQQSPYYDDYRMMQRPPSNQYHLTPPYAQRQQMPPNGYAAAAGGYSPQYQSTFRHPQQQQSMQQPGNHYYRPAVNGGPAPWHMDRPPSAQPQYPLQQRPPGESWTGWRN